MAAERIALDERTPTLVVAVDLVRRDDQHDGFRSGRTQCLEQVERADDVAGPGTQWIGIGPSHQCLRRHVDDDIGTRPRDRSRTPSPSRMSSIPDVIIAK